MEREGSKKTARQALRRPAVQLYLGLVAFSLVGSALAKISHSDASGVARLTGLLTLMVGCYAAFEGSFRLCPKRAPNALASVWGVGLLAELIGLATGYPFGRYRYTDCWWPVLDLPRIGWFPVQLPFAWMLIVTCSYLSLGSLAGRWSVPTAAALATLVDQVMEPTMTGNLHYWTWLDRGPMAGGTPVLNAVGWSFVSLIAAFCLKALAGKSVPRDSGPAIVLGGYVFLAVGLRWVA